MVKKVEASVVANTGEAVADVAQRKLYVRFPHRVPPKDDVMQLSPAITGVCYPRQKSTRFCHVILENEAAVPEVLKLLNKKKYNNGHLIVDMPRKLKYTQTGQALNVSDCTKQMKERRKDDDISTNKGNINKLSATQNNTHRRCKREEKVEQFSGGKYVLKKRRVKPATGGDKDRRLWMKKLPFQTDEKELIAAFPGCIWARVFKRKGSKASRAICKFSTAQQAASVMADHKKHQFKGKDILVELAKSQQLRGSREGKKFLQINSSQIGDIKERHSKQKERTGKQLEKSVASDCEELMDIQESEDANEESSDDLSQNADDDESVDDLSQSADD